MAKILVTGGAGYIGSAMVRTLLAGGYEVVVFDNLVMGHREAVPNEATFVEGDLADKEAVSALLAEHQPDGVFHFASRTVVGESMEKPFLYIGDNVRNALNLLEAMDEHGVKKIILSSTANLFDDPEKIPIGPDERIVPGSVYGESKAIIERFLHWLSITSEFRFACLRYFNAAGCLADEGHGEDHTPETHLIPIVLQVALGQRESIKVFGSDYDTPDGTCVRDYVHVADLAQAHVLAFEALDERPTQYYNLGNGAGFSVKEVIETARKITGHAIPAEFVERRAGDSAVLVADSSKIRDDLGWEPKYGSLEAIIASAWDWFRENPDGYSG